MVNLSVRSSVGKLGWLREMSPRSQRLATVVLALLAAAGAFLFWGPVPLGAGPLQIMHPPGEVGVVSGTNPAVITIALRAGSSGAVIDGVSLTGGRRYPAPHIIALHSNRDTPGCPGFWSSMTGPAGYYTDCAYGGPTTVGRLIGQPIPVSSTVQAPRSIQTQPGIAAMIVVGPPDGTVCWTVTSIAVYYHVGLKNYTATVGTDLDACVTQRAAQRLEGP
jgi:hypothetical protein